MKFPFECKTRGGDTAVILGINPRNQDDPVIGYLISPGSYRDGEVMWWTTNGKYYPDSDNDHDDDLMLPESVTFEIPLQLKVGRTYACRNANLGPVIIFAKKAGFFIGGSADGRVIKYKSNGFHAGLTTPRDLIREITPETEL